MPSDILELVLVVELVHDVFDDNELLDVVCLHSRERARVASKAKPPDSFVIICASKAGRLAIRVVLRIHECCVSSSGSCLMPYFIT